MDKEGALSGSVTILCVIRTKSEAISQAGMETASPLARSDMIVAQLLQNPYIALMPALQKLSIILSLQSICNPLCPFS